jgi:uncharacterized protein YjbJ (UPF0337 family)
MAAPLHRESPGPQRGPKGSHMNKDELKGKVKEAKGKVKEKAGELIDDPELQAKGVAEQGVGKVQEGLGAAKRKASDAIEDLRDDDDRA